LHASPNTTRYDQIKEDKMGGIYSTHGKDEKWIQYLGLENLKGRSHLEDLGVDEKTIL